MYLRDLWTSCARRWYVVLLCLVVSGGVLAVATAQVDPSYQSSASVVLVPPPNPDTPKLNRYLALGGLSQAVDVLARSMSSEQTVKSLRTTAPAAGYEVVGDRSTSAPVLLVTTTSSSPLESQDLLVAVLDKIPDNLRALQEILDIESASQITAVVISTDDKPSVVGKTRLRILGALGVALMLCSAVFIAAVDGLLLRRKQRRRSMAGPGNEPAEPTAQEPSARPQVPLHIGSADLSDPGSRRVRRTATRGRGSVDRPRSRARRGA